MSTQYPNVPNSPGVPPVLRQVGQVVDTVVLATADAVIIANLFTGPQWGLYNQDLGLLTGDSVLSVEFSKDFRVADYPIEDGGFVSYDKVATPFDARVTFTQGGTDAERAAFLASIDDAQTSLTLYTLVLPEIQYPNCNVVHYDYRRTSESGVTLLTVATYLKEIRQAQSSSMTNTQQASSQDSQSQGAVTPGAPTAAQSAAITTETLPDLTPAQGAAQ